ncbi:MAG TPA: HPF/RaiA family ribosome-associated protein [Ramlibacter sp.]|jgi:ribosome-associated translation inhibitor RaiA
MKLPVDIRFIGLEHSEALETTARERIARIDSTCDGLIGWRVTIEQSHKHQQHGRQIAVRIDVTLVGHEVAVEHVHDEDPYVALRDAFDAIRRRIEDTVRIQRGSVKSHAHPAGEDAE